MPDDERQIITKLVIEAAEAIASLEGFDQRLEETKKQLSSIVAQTGESFGEIGEKLKSAFESDALQPLIQQLEQAGQSVRDLQNIVGEGVKAKIVDTAGDEVQYVNDLRDQIDSIKQRMQELATVSDDSFRVLNKSIREVTIEELEGKIARVKAQIRALMTAPEGVIAGDFQIDTGAVASAELQLEELNRELKIFKEAAPIALQEVSQEAKEMGSAIQGTLTPLQQLVQAGQQAKQVFAEGEIKQLDVVDDEQVQQLAQLATELGSVEEALQQMKPDLQIDDALREQLQSVDADMRSFAQNISEQINQIRFDQIQQEAERLEVTLRETAEETGQAYADLAKQMKETFSAETAERFGGMTEGAKAEIREYSTALDQALKNIKQQTDQAVAAQREWEKATKGSLDTMSKEAEEYGQAVGRVSQVIQNTAKNGGKSWQTVANRMVQLGTPIKLVQNAMNQLGKTSQQVANVIKNTATSTGQSWQQVANQLQSMGVPLNTIRSAMQQLGQASQQASQNISSGLGGIGGGIGNLVNRLGGLGNIGKYVFGSVLGLTAISALRDLARAFKEFAQDILRRGAEMTEVIFTLEVAIRGLQRVGLDTTIDVWTESIQALKKEFPFFPKREFIEATSLAALMTREFGFTAEQIQNLVRQSAILAQITGKSLLESVRGISFAIGSGYFESLQRAGVNISRAVVAQEALRQGYDGVYNELEPAIRASVTYSVITRNLAAIQDDASKKSEVFAGQLQILNSTLEDLKNLFGEVVTSSDTFLDALRNVNELLTSIKNVYEALAAFDVDLFTPLTFLLGIDDEIQQIKNLADFINNLAEELETLNSRLRNTRIYIEALAEVAGALGFTTFESAIDSIIEKLFNAERSLGNFVDKLTPDEIDIDTTIGGIEFSREEYDAILDATEDLAEEIFDIEEDWYKRRLDIFSDFSRDMNKIQQDHYRKLQDLRRDHQQKMDAIDIKEGERLADEETSYLNKVADAERDAAFRREDAERKYRERELKQERKFQEKLRQLRENFILDLEDAVRDRDARQIIRLTKQYNLRRDQMIREEAINKDDRRSAFEEELRNIERQRAERLQQLKLDHERRNAEIVRQAEQERAKAQEDYERRKADERARADEQKAERERRRDEQLDDLDDWRAERIAKVIEGLQEEYGLTEEQLNAMVTLWESKFGVEGEIPVAVRAGVESVLNHLAALAAYMAQFEALKRSIVQQAAFANIPAGGYLGPPPDNAGGQAKGGTIIARRPTVALFGEAGPEMATFTPLNKMSGASMPNTQMFSTRDAQTGRISLEMLLSPDLEARIKDDTMNEIADVVYRIERERR